MNIKTIDEIWVPIKGYEGLYEVSDQGRVKSFTYLGHVGKVQILKPFNSGRGYLRVGLYKNSKMKMISIHRLVAEAFCPNPCPDKFDQVNHKDEDKTNNAASNLEWCDVKYNNNYGTHNERTAKANINNPKKSRVVQRFDLNGNLLATYPSLAEAHRVTGLRRHSILDCCQGKRMSVGGFIWRYA